MTWVSAFSDKYGTYTVEKIVDPESKLRAWFVVSRQSYDSDRIDKLAMFRELDHAKAWVETQATIG